MTFRFALPTLAVTLATALPAAAAPILAGIAALGAMRLHRRV